MPSGAKKRKAAKKKKEQEANNNNNLQGNGVGKSHDDRDSDGGEVGSPASLDNQSQQHHFDKVNEESEKRDSSVNASDTDKSFVEGQATAAGESQRVEQNEQIKDMRIDNDEKSSSSSSSDNESQASETKDKEDAQISEYGKPVEEVGINQAVQADKSADLDRLALPMSDVVERQMVGGQVATPEILNIIEPGVVRNKGISLPKIESTTQDEDKSMPDLYVVTKNTLPKSNELGGASKAAVVPENVASTVGENEGKLLASSRGHPEKTRSLNGDNNKMLTSSDAHSAETSKDVKNPKDDKTSECTEKQPLVGSMPGVAQRTSWLSCCGLLDAVTGSK